jgi:uncharacterized protein YjbK
MSENIEIEFKNLLTEEEFGRLKSFFGFDNKNFKKQVNHYFDTNQFDLKEQGCALRIREKKGQFEMTLKQPAPVGLLETNQYIPEQAAQNMLATGEIPVGPVRTALSALFGHHDPVVYFGSLTTERAEKAYQGGLVVLDHSTYLDKNDYELEYEAEEEKSGREIFHALLSGLNIPSRKTDNKVMRFYKQKQRISESNR